MTSLFFHVRKEVLMIIYMNDSKLVVFIYELNMKTNVESADSNNARSQSPK